MGRHPIQMLFGDPAIGNIGGETGLGHQATGRNLQGLMQSGFPDIGSRGEGVGPGILDIGSTANKFGVQNFEHGDKIYDNNLILIFLIIFFRTPKH